MATLYLTKENKPEDIFETIECLVASHGGDGDGIVYTENWRELTEGYDEYRKNHKYSIAKAWFKEFDEYQDYCLFTDRSNENIIFAAPNIIKNVGSEEVI